MNEAELRTDSCAPSDCADCQAECGSRIGESYRMVNITTDEGITIPCQVLLTYEMEEREYLAIMPVEDNSQGDIYLFRLVNNGTEMANIEDEEEYARAAKAFGIAMEAAMKKRG